MTSDAQRQANRRNAQKSTGPKTSDGKQRSCMNSLKVGAYLSENDHISATLLSENAEQVQELLDAIVEDLDPHTVLEATQARAIAQKILNQQRIDRLAPHLASAEEHPVDDSPTPRQLEMAEEFWRQVIHTISFRGEPAEPDMDYADIAKAFYIEHRNKLGPLRPAINPQLTGDASVEAWRDELCRLADIVYDSHDDARAQTSALRIQHGRAADRLYREIAGGEARRLVNAFDKALNLQDRVGRMIARDLKTYRELQASRPHTSTACVAAEDEPPRNEANPNM